MRNNDAKTREEIRAALQDALAKNDTAAFAGAMDDMIRQIAEEVKRDHAEKPEQPEGEGDREILAARGIRQLTSGEKKYYRKLGEAMQANDIKQALADAELTMPETIVNSVFEDLATDHPLLSHISFASTGGAIRMLLNTDGTQEAQWGTLTADITKELMSGFQEVNTELLKLTAFLPVCKAMLELGPEWMDRYVREVMYEALANGLEKGIVKGSGKEEPIGMIREVGEGVTVKGGVYTEKERIRLTEISTETIGNLLSIMAVTSHGKPRNVEDVIFIVNPQDYFKRVMPATTIMAPDGTYRNDVMPYPMKIITCAALEQGEAIIGLGRKFFAAAGMSREGRIEYSDHVQFLEDNRVYLVKLYANGFPMDNHAFLHLDISDLQPKKYRVVAVSDAEPSADAALASLKIGSLTLSPAFASETTEYTAATANATNTITATPSDASAEIEITVRDTPLENGAAAEWQEGSNTVKITVTAADGKTTKTYTIAVTKS